MTDENEFESERRPLLRRRRPEPEPGPTPGEDHDNERPERRRRFLGAIARAFGNWGRLFVESPVVLRFIFWAVFILLVAWICRTFRGTR